MYLLHLICKFIDLIFPAAYKKYMAQAQNEAWPYDDKRFSDHAVRLIYSDLKLRKQEAKKLWIVHSPNNLAPYLFFNSIVGAVPKTLIRNAAKHITIKAPLVDGKCYLRLVEYPVLRWESGKTMRFFSPVSESKLGAEYMMVSRLIFILNAKNRIANSLDLFSHLFH